MVRPIGSISATPYHLAKRAPARLLKMAVLYGLVSAHT